MYAKEWNDLRLRFKSAARSSHLSETSIAVYLRNLAPFLRFVARTRPRELTRDHMRDYLAHLKESPTSRGTVRKLSSVRIQFIVARQFIAFLLGEQILADDPTAGIRLQKAPVTTPKIPSYAEALQLFDFDPLTWLGRRNRCFIGFLLLAGCRKSEVLGIDLDDISSDLSEVTVTGKGNKQRVVAIHPRLRRLIEDYLELRPADAHATALFVTSRGSYRGRMSGDTLYRTIKRKAAALGLSGSKVRPHALRHVFATEMRRLGIDIADLMEQLGHSSVAMTLHYARGALAKRKDAVAKLDADAA
jgi:site-specific recombinase XerD